MSVHPGRESLRRSLPFHSEVPVSAPRFAALLIAAALFSQACGDGKTSGSGGGTTTATGGQSTGTTSSSGSGGSSGSSGSGTGAGGTGAGGTSGTGGTGGTGTGGVSGGTGTGGQSTGGAGTGGQVTGGGGTGGSGMGGSGMGGGGTGGAGMGGAVGQGGQWMSPPLVMMPALPSPPDYSDHPVDAQGRPIVMAGAGINWVVPATPDAITARELCADLVANCFEPGVRSLDACMMSAPHCATATPWTEPAPCCADACFTAYAALRTNKVDPLTAYLRVLYDSPICMPGVDSKLGGAP